jgi:N-acetylmuramoyl-L-alanine amidase
VDGGEAAQIDFPDKPSQTSGAKRLRLVIKADSTLVHARHASPNIESRKGQRRPNILLLHYTGMMSAEKAIEWLARPESGVSCHYVIDREGCITQMVAEEMRAWHAGVSYWAGETDINSCSIGIEIDNPGHELGYPEFPEAQMRAVEALSRDIVARWDIRPERVLAHSDIAPTRKLDPGEKFDWARLARVGVGHWVEPAPVKAGDDGIDPGYCGPQIYGAQDLLRRYGYGVHPSGQQDPQTEAVIRAFQRHFRPARVDGRVDQSTIATLERLLAALDERASIA